MRDHLTLKDLQAALGTGSPENAGQAWDPALLKFAKVFRVEKLRPGLLRALADQLEQLEAEEERREQQRLESELPLREAMACGRADRRRTSRPRSAMVSPD